MDINVITPKLERVGNIPPPYVHHDCWVEPGELAVLPAAILKWYNVGRPGVAIPSTFEPGGRAFLDALASSGQFDFGHGLGWVLLHDCVATTFLIVGVWNDANECRHTIFARDPHGPVDQFIPVEIGAVPKPMACVWELTPIWHERNAWSHFLYSTRDSAAKLEYLQDQLSGVA